jgi:uncharacterized protein
MQFNEAGRYILNKLANELPQKFTYHNIEHTRDVYRAAERIAKQEGINDTDTRLLLTAAWYHDTGYLNGTIGHEEESCRIASSVLPGYGYTADEISLICGMIRATKVPQLPKTLLESILADADLDYLGRDDFFITGKRLFDEFILEGSIGNENSWNELQLKFMENHQYFTKTAINLRQAKKMANMVQIKAQLTNTTGK